MGSLLRKQTLYAILQCLKGNADKPVGSGEESISRNGGIAIIDIENDIFAAVAVPLREKYGKDSKGQYNIWVSGESADVPAKFPAVTIEEKDNYVYTRARTTKIENAANVMYEINVYTNRVGYKKQDAQEIMSFIDEILSSLGFTRTMMQPIDNLSEATIYRMVARYEAIVDTDFMIYQT